MARDLIKACPFDKSKTCRAVLGGSPRPRQKSQAAATRISRYGSKPHDYFSLRRNKDQNFAQTHDFVIARAQNCGGNTWVRA
jgi:hypothetical protein